MWRRRPRPRVVCPRSSALGRVPPPSRVPCGRVGFHGSIPRGSLPTTNDEPPSDLFSPTTEDRQPTTIPLQRFQKHEHLLLLRGREFFTEVFDHFARLPPMPVDGIPH